MSEEQNQINDFSWVQEGAECWYQKIDKSKHQINYQGKITEIDQNNNKKVLVEFTKDKVGNNKSLWVQVDTLFLKSFEKDLFCDMVNMEILNEAEILSNLQQRFNNKEIYTMIGSTLIVMNPFQKLSDLYTYGKKHEYFQYFIDKHTLAQRMPPHVYQIAAQAYDDLFTHFKKQAIVISGESGAGKTINAKDCMEFLTTINKFQQEKLGSQQSGDGDINIEKRILDCNPILEAFGNAKTVRNHNSSRFGKYVSLIFDTKSKQITGAQIKNYLLEKARIVKLGQNERNFHIFYHLLFGAEADYLKKFGIEGASDHKAVVKKFNYLNQSAVYEVQTVNDQELYQEVVESFQELGFQNYIDSIMAVISFILYLGNLDFDKSTMTNDTPCTVASKADFQHICDLLGLEPESFEKSIVLKKRVLPGNKVTLSPLEYDKCLLQRDATSKLIYGQLFIWIVKKLNETIVPKDFDEDDISSYDNTIGLLDIYGFEVFQKNGFEQFFINYTNECLAKLYIQYVFEQEKVIFQNEGLDEYLTEMQFRDNQPIIDVLDQGIFKILNDQCTLAFNTDQTFLNQVKKELKDKKTIIDFPKFGDKFKIIHSSKDVEYDVDQFLEKNMDETPEELLKCFQNSTNELVRQIFPSAEEMEQQAQEKKKNAKEKFLGFKFKQEMGTLMSILISSDCHFIRCIKSNDDKKPFIFWEDLSMEQIRSLGILETIQVRKYNYALRKPYKQFYKQYSFLCSQQLETIQKEENNHELDYKQLAMNLYNENFKQVESDPKQIIFGNTKIFMHAEVQVKFDEYYQSHIKKQQLMARRLQRAFRRKRTIKKFRQIVYATVWVMRCKKNYKKNKEIIFMKKCIRRMVKNHRIKKMNQRRIALRKSALVIQKQARTALLNKQIDHFMWAIVRVQRFWRFLVFREKIRLRLFMKKQFFKSFEKAWLHVETKAAILIQKNVRGFLLRQKEHIKVKKIKLAGKMAKYHRCATVIQKYVRRYLMQSFYLALKYKTTFIQAWIKSVWLTRFLQNVRKATIVIQRQFRKYLIIKRAKDQRFKEYLQQTNIPGINNAEHQILFQKAPKKIHNNNNCQNINELQFSQLIDKSQDITVSYINSFQNDDYDDFDNTQNFQHQTQQQILNNNDLSRIPMKQNNQQQHQQQARKEQFYFDQSHTMQLQNKVYLFAFPLDVEFLTDITEIYNKPWSHSIKQFFEHFYHSQTYIQDIQISETSTTIANSHDQTYLYGLNQQQKQKLEIPGTQMIVSGQNHHLLLDSSGTVYGWGDNMYGQLGSQEESYVYSPQPLYPHQNIQNIQYVECSQFSSYMIDKKGTVYQLGGKQEHEQQRIQKIKFPEPENTVYQTINRMSPSKVFQTQISRISCGYDFTMFLSDTGLLFSKGKNQQGQLGLGDNDPRKHPTLVPIQNNDKVIDLSCGFKHTVIQTRGNKVWTWGWGKKGQLGIINGLQDECIPQQVNLPKTQAPLQVTASYSASYVLTQKQQIYFFGSNSNYSNIDNPIIYNIADNIPQFSGDDFIPVKISGKWSLSMSMVYITFGYSSKVNKNRANICKNKKQMQILSQKWLEHNIKTVNPPYIECLKNTISNSNMKIPPIHNESPQKKLQSQNSQQTLQPCSSQVVKKFMSSNKHLSHNFTSLKQDPQYQQQYFDNAYNYNTLQNNVFNSNTSNLTQQSQIQPQQQQQQFNNQQQPQQQQQQQYFTQQNTNLNTTSNNNTNNTTSNNFSNNHNQNRQINNNINSPLPIFQQQY